MHRIMTGVRNAIGEYFVQHISCMREREKKRERERERKRARERDAFEFLVGRKFKGLFLPKSHQRTLKTLQSAIMKHFEYTILFYSLR